MGLGFRRQRPAPAVMTIRLQSAARLYNSFDPAPFNERDLDPEADAFLFGWAQDLGPGPYRLVIELPPGEERGPASAAIGEAVRNHFRARLVAEQRKLRLEFRRGRLSLGIGLAFLAACLLLRQIVPDLIGGPVAEMLAEGLLILGWVAMWGPLEVFLYGWWPISGTCRLLAHLAEMPVDIAAGPHKAP